MNDFVPAQTSVPDWLMTYCRQLADVHHGRRLNRMYEFLLEGFLNVEPWKANPPLEWRKARIHGSTGRSRKGADMGWVPMNMMLPAELVEKIKNVIEMINLNSTHESPDLSLRTFLYTAIYWWCTFVYPYEGAGILPE